jgi:hypothetical protein
MGLFDIGLRLDRIFFSNNSLKALTATEKLYTLAGKGFAADGQSPSISYGIAPDKPSYRSASMRQGRTCYVSVACLRTFLQYAAP